MNFQNRIIFVVVAFVIFLSLNGHGTEGAENRKVTATTKHAKRSGLCPQPNCEMNVNCAPSYDCCVIGGSKFCVPTPCPATRSCRYDSDCHPEEDKCCATKTGRTVCTHAVFV